MAKIKAVIDAEGKKNRRLEKWLKTLSKEQRELLTEYSLTQSEADLMIQFQAYERVLRPALNVLTGDVVEAEKILIGIIGQVGIEGITARGFKRGEWYMKYIDEIKGNIVSEYTMRKAKGEKEKDIIENIWSKYPKVSRNAVKNAILKHKKELRKQELSEGGVDAAVKYIFEDNKEEKEIKEEPKEMREEIKEIKSEEKSKFKVLKKTVIVDVAGEFGEYHVENGRVSHENFVFNNEEDVKKEFNSRKEAFLKVIESEEAEMLEVMETYK